MKEMFEEIGKNPFGDFKFLLSFSILNMIVTDLLLLIIIWS